MSKRRPTTWKPRRDALILWKTERMLHWITAGESHGPALVAVLEGLPSGVPITTEMLKQALAVRRLGYGRGTRQKFEQDEVRILAGVRHGLSTGAPVAIEIANSEWPKWQDVMSADPVDPDRLLVDAGRGDYREMSRNKRLTAPRPGHADLPGMLSYRSADARDILERASARETAARVALGAIARSFLLRAAGIEVLAHVVAVGPARSSHPVLPRPGDDQQLNDSPMRTLSRDDEGIFIGVIDEAREAADTVGGVAEVVAWQVPLGLGSHVSADQKLDARLASALMGIQSVKAVEIGDGFDAAAAFGSAAQDQILPGNAELRRGSNRAGGIEGGTSNGQPIVVRLGFKPISTVPRPLSTVDVDTGKETRAFHQRSDTCQVVPGAVIAQAMTELVLAQALTERFGGHSLAEVTEQIQLQNKYVADRLMVVKANDE